MARDAVALTALTLNDGVAVPTEVEINVTNGASIDVGGKTANVVISVLNNYAGAKKVTVKAGVNPPAFRAALGDASISIDQNVTKMIVVESARFVQADGKIYLDFESAMTGHLWAYLLPAGM